MHEFGEKKLDLLSSPLLRIEILAEAVADEVKRQNSKADRDSRKEENVR